MDVRSWKSEVGATDTPLTDSDFDFGGTGPILHFAHANGYPPAAYTPLLDCLTPRFHVVAMCSRPLQPGADPASLRDWTQLVDDQVAFLEQAGGPVVGVGHSLGAVVTVLSAVRRPDLLRAVVAIDPVFLSPPKAMAYSLFRSLGLADRVHPFITVARRRRRYFASADEMYARYREAPVFSRLDDQALRRYVDAAVRSRTDGPGVELVFTPEWEAQVYATGPSNFWGQLGRLRVPLLAIRGAESDAFDLGAVQELQHRLPQATVVEVPDTGHLVPLEKPAEVASLILDFTF
jgi:pimeloyl-ACP methyl ester carboxylesterase